jgi:putative DNA primase/helicase
VFINTLISLFGEENKEAITLHDLLRPEYRFQLHGKMINVSFETEVHKALDTGIIKALTSGDVVMARDLYKSPIQFRSYAKHFIAMNRFPKIQDQSYGFWRRLYLIEFNRRFSEQEADETLTDKLKQEIPGILNWALEGYYALKANRFRFTKPSRMSSRKREELFKDDSRYHFIREHLVPSPGTHTKVKDIMEAYVKYCAEMNEKATTRSEMIRLLEKAKYHVKTGKGVPATVLNTALV